MTPSCISDSPFREASRTVRAALPVSGDLESALPFPEASKSALLSFGVSRSFRVTGIDSPLNVNFILRSAVWRSSDKSVVMT